MRDSTARSRRNRLCRTGILAVAGTLLAGCNALDRLSSVGEAPAMTAVQNPTHQPGYRPVSMPMPTPVIAERTPNSLWRTGSRAFFKDLRANEVGDIVTVVIEINDSAEVNNSTTRRRTNSEDASMGALLGYEQSLSRILPDEVNPSNLLDLNSSLGTAGAGAIDREEKIEVKVAAVVTQLLPNGNLVIVGRQETRVNYEVRELQVAGVIRPQDITANNQITYDKIAEARLAYGGRGQISDLQQPRYGQQIIDILFPF